ncbi:MAG TPA: aldo/keto reductase [Candidatus Latescibacteria bacterium]|jgi:aryl-alcohol dehydrogenase-like predicted oxidoreductase|nr:aldo/keto reductase [Candidatus Latescibacterota bacterium]HJP31873.1 aldo/keto reductase [Candidatus Latescibacterota bacterium]|tara:strand:- start:406 stop:1389 length:984 start_codon:yes stop_codon:yes gene_type:complete
MQYRKLGNTGVKVSEICLGTAFRGQDDEQQCIRTIDRAIDLGCNFVDSAFYGEGRAETVLGKAIAAKRQQVVLCTKIYGTRYGDANSNNLTRLNLMRGIEDSLTRLNTEYIDLYLLHSFDAGTPLEETLRALDDLVRTGKVRYIGCSNFRAWKVLEALWTSDRRNLARFVCIQDQYNLLNRWELEPDLMPLCEEHGLGITAYSPLAIGLLTGRFRRGQAPPAGNHPWSKEEGHGFSAHKYDFDAAMTERVDRIVQALIDAGARHDRTPTQVAIAWILDHPQVTAPILGADSPEQVDEAFAALDWCLPPEERVILDGVSEVKMPAKWA